MDANRTRHFKVRSSDVVSEIIDGEAVIMDLRSGHYFSAREAAGPVWQSIASGQSDTAILASLRTEFDADPDALREQLDHFIDQLMHNALIVVDTVDTPAAADDATTRARGPRPFTPLVLEVFQDMEDLLLLDPIHDVQEEFGWPVKKPGQRDHSRL
jgi:hypothetical protein